MIYTWDALIYGPGGYTPDRVEQLLRCHWSRLEAEYVSNEDVASVYFDLFNAACRLEPDSRKVVGLLMQGYATGGQYAEIAKRVDQKGPMVKEILKEAYLIIAIMLGYTQE